MLEKYATAFFKDVGLLTPECNIEIIVVRFIRFLEHAFPGVHNTLRNSKPFGEIDDRMTFIDELLDLLELELGGLFRSLHLHLSKSVLTKLFVY